MAESIAFVGLGEAGQTIGRGLVAQGARLRAYDILFDHPANEGRLRRTAEDLGIAVSENHINSVRDADIIFLAVTASSSLEAARSCLPGLRKGQLFLDINSVSPPRDTKSRSGCSRRSRKPSRRSTGKSSPAT